MAQSARRARNPAPRPTNIMPAMIPSVPKLPEEPVAASSVSAATASSTELLTSEPTEFEWFPPLLSYLFASAPLGREAPDGEGAGRTPSPKSTGGSDCEPGTPADGLPLTCPRTESKGRAYCWPAGP